MTQLHIGCGSTVVPGWENIDSSPSVLLTRVPGLRRALGVAGILSPEQLSAVFPPGIIHADVRKPLRYADGSVQFIYSSHLIEHLARWQALAMLHECHRVLVPGGVLRIATPDLEAMVAGYVRDAAGGGAGSPPADSFMAHMLTFAERPENRVRRVLRRLFTAPHQWLYDEASLGALFREAGFDKPERSQFRRGALPDLDLLEQRDESLFMEAQRSPSTS